MHVIDEGWCALEQLLHTHEDMDRICEKMVAYEESYPEAPEEIGPVELVGLGIAKSIQQQSEEYCRTRRFPDSEVYH